MTKGTQLDREGRSLEWSARNPTPAFKGDRRTEKLKQFSLPLDGFRSESKRCGFEPENDTFDQDSCSSEAIVAVLDLTDRPSRSASFPRER